MKKNLLITILLLVVLAISACLAFVESEWLTGPVDVVFDTEVLDSTFVIEGEEYLLEDGLAVKMGDPLSSFAVTLRVFGEPVYGDLDGDGDVDAALWLEYQPGGSGTFYYAALVMKDDKGYRATNVVLLGDRIAPQSLNILEGRAVYNFADRRADEPFSMPPSIGKSVYIHYDVATGEVGEWVKDFEGEGNPTEVYRAQVDRVSVVFENYNYTSYRLITNGLVRTGDLNTERSYQDDVDATVYILDWQKPEGEQMRYVRMASEPGKLFLLNSAGEFSGTPLNLE
jgi:hypothetical protein